MGVPMDWTKLLAKALKLRFDGSTVLRVYGEFESYKGYSLDFLEAFARLGCYNGPPRPLTLTPPNLRLPSKAVTLF